MADFVQKNDLDLRFGGSTLGDFGYFYDVELPWLYACINSIRRNQASPSSEQVEPVANQLKVEDDKIYFRNSTNTDWVCIGDVSFNFGLRASESETVLLSTDKAEIGSSFANRANKLAVYDSNGKLDHMLDTDNLPTNNTAEGKANKLVVYNSNGKIDNMVDTSYFPAEDTAAGRANKIVRYNEYGNIIGNITGNAGTIGGMLIDISGGRDGQLLGFDSTANKIRLYDRLSTGNGAITFSADKPTDGSFWLQPITE